MTRAQKLLRIAFAVHVVLGAVLIVAIVVSSPWVIGQGRFEELVTTLERIDWRWWVLVPLLILWAVPIVAVTAWQQARSAGLEVQKVRQLVSTLLENRQIPIAVDVDTSVPVSVSTPLTVPVQIDTNLPLDAPIDIEAELPLRLDLSLDTNIETSVLGLGKIHVPIKARVPIDVVVPIRGRFRVKSTVPVHLKEDCVVGLPTFEVPIRSRIETRIDLLDNLRLAEQHLRKKLGRDKGGAETEALPEDAAKEPPAAT